MLGTDGRSLIIEVKKHKDPIGSAIVDILIERTAIFAAENPDRGVQACLLATGGFRQSAMDACKGEVATAETINYVHKTWPVPG